MAIFRKIHTSFWSDPFIEDLDRDKKLFYLYLLTNEKTKQCGIYEISKKQIAYDLGYTIDTVSKMLQYFIDSKKIKYSESTNEIAIGNWLKYNKSSSPKVEACINKEFEYCKDRVLIEYVKSIGTLSQEEQEEEQEQTEEEDAGNEFPEITILAPETEFDKFNNWLKEKCPAVCKIKDQLTEQEFKTLKQLHPSEKIANTLLSMQNHKGVEKKYTSVYLTLNNWLKNDKSTSTIERNQDTARIVAAKIMGDTNL